MWVNKLTVLLAAAIFLMIAVYSPASAREITVDDNGPGANFHSIEEAVTNSSSGDVILVCPGNYNESVGIRTQNISILSESENPEDTNVRAFNLNANNITVSGFSIQEVLSLQEYISPTGYSSHYPVENCTVKNNILKLGIDAKECLNFTTEKNVILNSGISVSGSNDAVISNLRISDNLIVNGSIEVNQGQGNCVLLNSGNCALLNSGNCVLLNNTILNGRIVLNNCCGYKILENYISNKPYGSDGSGIVLYDSDFSEIENNTVVNCSEGIRINSESNKVENNILTYNGQGIVVGLSEGNLFSNNTISNSSIGISLNGPAFIGDQAGGNSILNNTISNNNIGILFKGDSSSNLVANNKVELSKQCGVYVEEIGYEIRYNATNWLYNNMFNNTVNLFNNKSDYKSNYYAAQSVNNSTGKISITLNTTKTSGTNIVCGPHLGGNYWAKPDGTGFSQNCVDSDGDGIGDLPYNINENETDYLPLVSPPPSQESISPVANFSNNITQNLAPVAVQFTDLSRNAVLWDWDFDSDGISDSTNQNPAYLYTIPGTYIVNLTVSNGKDTSSKNMRIILRETEVPPVADFKTNITSGQVPLSVLFTDLSKNATSWIWDFNNDGIADSTEKNPVYVYTYPGNYTVNLTVDNIKGTASKLSTITTSPAQRIDGELVLTEYQITSNDSRQLGPAIYGDRIVWMDYRNENGDRTNSDIYMYNLSTHKENQITTSRSGQYNLDINGNNIVWNDWRDGSEKRDIYMYNISTSTETQITTNKSDKWLPAIYEDKIAWIDYRNGKSAVYMYNLSTSRETQITTSESDNKYDPDIYGDKVVWVDGGVYIYDLSTSRETQITSTQSLKHQPVIYGNRIVWHDESNGNYNIYMYDLSTSRETRITTNGPVSWPDVYGDRIVWAGYRNGNWDIYMYDLSTKKETQITTNESDQEDPAIYGDRIVWIDYRNGFENPDIYMCTISKEKSGSKILVADFSAFPTYGNAPLKVLFTGNSKGVPTSWLWNFGDGINSKHTLNATHTFTKPGKYDVSLTVTNENGSNTWIRPGYITVYESK